MEKDNRTPIILRLVIAGAVGIVVSGICLNLTWGAAGVYIRYPQVFTEKTLKITDRAIKVYRQKKGALPQSLSELRAVPDDAPVIQEGGVIWDSWRHPLVYKVHGGNYLVISYGRDGRPSGVGLDCDLSNVNPRPPEAKLPFLQVLLHPLAHGMVWMSIFSGAIAFLLTFSIVKPTDLSRQGSVGLAAKLLVTLIATLFVATFITMLHVPSGH